MKIHRFVAVAALMSVCAGGVVHAQPLGDAERGGMLAERYCAACHGIRPGLPSPRPESPTFQRIAGTPGMTGLAIKVWLQTSHPTMPDLILPAADRDDLAAYITSLKPAP